MEITIKATPKEIADLVKEVQSQQNSDEKFDALINSQTVWKAIHDTYSRTLCSEQKQQKRFSGQ